MSYYIAYKESTGEIVAAGSPMTAYGDTAVICVSAQIDISTHYVNGATLTPMPPKPSRHHVFNYTTKQWVLDESKAKDEASIVRSRHLMASDWTQLPDVPLATKEAWATYRQALRDITEQEGYPLNINWPISP